MNGGTQHSYVNSLIWHLCTCCFLHVSTDYYFNSTMSGPQILTGIARAITGNLREIAIARPNLMNVSTIDFSFSPWNKNSSSTKFMWRRLCGEKCRKTNRFCAIKTNVLHEDTEPLVEVTFFDGEKLCLHGAYLKYNEMMYHFNNLCNEKDKLKSDAPTALF
ncbi:unnamed protein product [Clavelina lepadiformis]|uniref:Large ribosomal subunit protein mL53 n=1 Tax=Clavelina lepadiformis TaxID=159417 RepID=A0ABP0G152_CLALP